jgi:hypothetical protein
MAGIALAAVAFGLGAGPASADPGGNPNVAACTGQVIAILARAGSEGAGKVNVQDISITLIRGACAAGDSVATVVQKVREAAGIEP